MYRRVFVFYGDHIQDGPNFLLYSCPYACRQQQQGEPKYSGMEGDQKISYKKPRDRRLGVFRKKSNWLFTFALNNKLIGTALIAL